MKLLFFSYLPFAGCVLVLSFVFSLPMVGGCGALQRTSFSFVFCDGGQTFRPELSRKMGASKLRLLSNNNKVTCV